MVLRFPGMNLNQLFVRSDNLKGKKSDAEIAEWARSNGFQPAQPSHTYAIFQDGIRIREWILLDRPNMTLH